MPKPIIAPFCNRSEPKFSYIDGFHTRNRQVGTSALATTGHKYTPPLLFRTLASGGARKTPEHGHTNQLFCVGTGRRSNCIHLSFAWDIFSRSKSCQMVGMQFGRSQWWTARVDADSLRTRRVPLGVPVCPPLSTSSEPVRRPIRRGNGPRSIRVAPPGTWLLGPEDALSTYFTRWGGYNSVALLIPVVGVPPLLAI